MTIGTIATLYCVLFKLVHLCHYCYVNCLCYFFFKLFLVRFILLDSVIIGVLVFLIIVDHFRSCVNLKIRYGVFNTQLSRISISCFNGRVCAWVFVRLLAYLSLLAERSILFIWYRTHLNIVISTSYYEQHLITKLLVSYKTCI